jgi:hypothetical protein
MTLPELDPDHLDTLETWDTGLPRVLFPRDGLAGDRQAPRAEATIVVCLAEDGSLSEYALLTVDEPVRQVYGPPLPPDEIALYADWIARHRDHLIANWYGDCDAIDSLKLVDGWLLTSVETDATGLAYRIYGRAADYGPIEPGDTREPTIVVERSRDGPPVIMTVNEPVRQVFGAPLPETKLVVIAGWVAANRDALLAHWRGETSSRDFLAACRKV